MFALNNTNKANNNRLINFLNKPQSIKLPQVSNDIIHEINKIKNSVLCTKGDFIVFLADSSQIPVILKELGRLREITFRSIGEGTNKSFDLDRFDAYYKHLILWNSKHEKIAGAYRIGRGSEIINTYGYKGFYTSTLFKFSKVYKPRLTKSVELGRSFITTEFQKQLIPLHLLWEAIFKTINKWNEVQFIIGPVSISNTYSNVSKEIIISHLIKYYMPLNSECLIKPKNSFNFNTKMIDFNVMNEFTGNSLLKLNKLIASIEPTGMTLPVLIKKYLAQNAKIYAFNLDKKFNQCVDAFMELDISNSK